MADKPVEAPHIDETAIAEQAARWHAVLKTAGPRELADLAAWLKMSPRHGHHFLYATAVDRLLDDIDPEKTKFDPHVWVKQAHENIVSLSAPRAPSVASAVSAASSSGSHGRHRSFILASAAASLVVLIAAGWLFATGIWGWKEFSTGTGEQRAIELEDGSILHLNTATQLQVRLTEAARDIRLLEGEALFKVHRDAIRPFRVYAPGSVIQAVGTQFNVYRRDDTTRVSVLEGAVRISAETSEGASTADAAGGAMPTSLTAGQEVEINPLGRVGKRIPADVVNVVAWRQRRLVFQADALVDMAGEFNRYNRAPKFRLDGIDGHARHYTGTFDADDPESFATVLSQENVYAIEHTPEEIVIRPRSPATQGSAR